MNYIEFYLPYILILGTQNQIVMFCPVLLPQSSAPVELDLGQYQCRWMGYWDTKINVK